MAGERVCEEGEQEGCTEEEEDLACMEAEAQVGEEEVGLALGVLADEEVEQGGEVAGVEAVVVVVGQCEHTGWHLEHKDRQTPGYRMIVSMEIIWDRYHVHFKIV